MRMFYERGNFVRSCIILDIMALSGMQNALVASNLAHHGLEYSAYLTKCLMLEPCNNIRKKPIWRASGFNIRRFTIFRHPIKCSATQRRF